MLIIKRLRVILIMVVFVIFLQSFNVLAKPMLAPTLDEAISSDAIVLAEYIGYNDSFNIEYFNGPIAHYKVIRILKGDSVKKYIKVEYSFHDGSPCMEPEDWKFSSSIMPKVGSKFILFINGSDKHDYYYTYRGDYGRKEADEKYIHEIEGAVISNFGEISKLKPIETSKPIIIKYKVLVMVAIAVLLFLLICTRVFFLSIKKKSVEEK